MSTTVKIIADSISNEGVRLTTYQLRYPRFIHAELMTHRVFSRNASSSRAIPVAKMIEELRRDPAMPIYWGSNKPGMQAGEELEEREKSIAQKKWLYAMSNMIASAQDLIELGLHKQIANRILEPWAHINVVVTATQWQNFFTLRCHADAQPEIKQLADMMKQLMDEATPTLLESGQWHLPYIGAADFAALDPDITDENAIELLRKVSVARCARVSYMTHDGRQTTMEEDLALYEKLVVKQPLHASPAEHQATPDKRMEEVPGMWLNEHLHGNLPGYIQYRKTLTGEFISG